MGATGNLLKNFAIEWFISLIDDLCSGCRLHYCVELEEQAQQDQSKSEEAESTIRGIQQW